MLCRPWQWQYLSHVWKCNDTAKGKTDRLQPRQSMGLRHFFTIIQQCDQHSWSTEKIMFHSLVTGLMKQEQYVPKQFFFYIDSQNTARLLTLTPICVWIHSLITTQNKVTLVQANNPHLFFDNPDTCMCVWLVYSMFFNLLVNFLQLCEWIGKKNVIFYIFFRTLQPPNVDRLSFCATSATT